ncbi:MAG: DUF4383 domain-containing protein [Kibdelosporangium sp.]
MTAILKTDGRLFPYRAIVLGVGVAYVVLAYWGFFSLSDQTQRGRGLYGGNEGDLVLDTIGVSTVSSLVHALCGVFLIMAGFTLARSAMFGWAGAGVLGVLGVYAVVACLADYGDALNLTWANLWLYWVSAAIVAIAVYLSRRRAQPAEAKY